MQFPFAQLNDIQRDAEYSEEHVHTKARWYGKKAVQTATEWAVRLDTGLSLLYRTISGAGVYGADANDTALVFGSGDTFAALSNNIVMFDCHQILVVANSSATLTLLRMVYGTPTQSLADAVNANQYTEFPYLRANADNVRKIQDIKTPLIRIGSQVWIQSMNASDNATVDFIVGVHGYEF